MNPIVETLGALFAIDNNIDFFISHFPQMILIFAVISCGGWIYETIYCSIVDGELSKRGFLFGPSCPIYGIGALAIWIVLGSISNPLIVFVLGGMLATTIEYSTGLFLEHRFKKKWWDYSMFKYNLHGIVCPQASAVFGAFSVMSVFIFIPKMMSILSIFSFHTLSIMAFIVVSLYLSTHSLVFYGMDHLLTKKWKTLHIMHLKRLRQLLIPLQKQHLKKWIRYLVKLMLPPKKSRISYLNLFSRITSSTLCFIVP